MRRLFLILALIPLLATDPSWPPPDSPFNPGSDFPDDDLGGATCGREITCLDGAKVSCEGGPAGQCSYRVDACLARKHVPGYVKCGVNVTEEKCNAYHQCM
ncbi:MAG: hypothetical protein QNK37_26805 [Acidobacteriota bacterium]|nr:hypothetical protein [Acidobacteriota bacterium]